MYDEDPELDWGEEEMMEPAPDWTTTPQSDHVQWALATGSQGDTESRVIQAFLGSAGRTSMARQHPTLFARIHCVALAPYLTHLGCQIEGIIRLVNQPHHQVITAPDLAMVETSPCVHEPIPEQGLIFIRRPGGERMVLKLETDPYPPQAGSCFTVIDARGWGGTFLNGWENYAIENAYLRGKAFYATGELVSVDPFTGPDDVLMEPDVRRKVDRLILSFPEQVRRFRGRGLSAKRGVILEGPPGTGKTMLCRALCNELKCTFIWLTSRHLCEEPGKLAQVWHLARMLSPTVILLEDLDLIAESRDASFHGFLLGELMNQMDGVENNDGILTIATTNRLEVIEKAVRNRPGRFDHAIHMGALDEAGRRTLLNRYLQNEDMEEHLLDRLVRRTMGYTGARLIDLIKSLVERAVEPPSDNGKSRLAITSELIDEVLRNAEPATERKPIGFASEQAARTRLRSALV